MRRFAAQALVLGVVSIFALGPARARADSGWEIRNFDVQLEVQPDAGLDVTETIDADFFVPKHGILREMPIRYAVGMHQYELRVRLRGVDDGEGREYETSISYEDNLMKIRIGSPEYTVARTAAITACGITSSGPSSGRATTPGKTAIPPCCAGTRRGRSGRCRSTPPR